MRADFPLIDPVRFAFGEIADSAPVVRRTFALVARAVVSELPSVIHNEERLAFWRLLQLWCAKNEANVAGLMAGRDGALRRAVGDGG
jgi:hypothetical protein